MTVPISVSDLINKMSGGNSGNHEVILMSCLTGEETWAPGGVYSGWRMQGSPGKGVTPTTVAAVSNTTQGSVAFRQPTGGRVRYIVWAAASITQPNLNGPIFLYDRLLHIGGLSGTVTTAQTVAGTIGRNTGGVGNHIFIEINTNLGTTKRTLTASYTNQAGTSGRTSRAVTVGGTAAEPNNDPGSFLTVPLAAGDTGVRSVESVTLSGSTGTAGDFGVVIGRPIMVLAPGQQGASVSGTLGVVDMPYIEAGACLAYSIPVTTPNEVPFYIALSTVES